MKTILNSKMSKLGLSLSLCGFASLAHGQGVGEEDVIVLDEVAAESVPIEESILATTRPITSVYGTERSILDTPRNVNIISREQLDAISIKDVRDFSKLTSSSYTKSNFGAPTTPNLRGQEADLFINGVRRGHSVNGNGVPINFNSVESVNIVKGPAGAVYGTSNYVGGYADLVTKRAYFENGGEIKYSYGSYEQHTIDLDVNYKISDTVAARISYQGKDWDGFWDRWYQESSALYATVTWKPNDKYRLDVMGEYYKGNYTENWGINRVTQDLVDNGLYIPNAQTNAEWVAYSEGLGTTSRYSFPPPDFAPVASDPNGASIFGGAGFATVSPLDLDNPVKIDRATKLASPGDDSNADVFWAQAIQEFTVSDSFKVLNNTYFHYKDRDTFSSYHYSELMRDNWSLDNRLQVIQEIETGENTQISLNYGVRVRYQDIMSVNHFFNEPVNFWDLTRDPDTWRVPDAGFAGSFYVEGEDGRGILDRWYVGSPGEARDTQTWIVGPFAQFDVQLTERLSILAGYTFDIVEHTESLPDEVVAFDGSRPDGLYEDEGFSGSFYNANISVLFKPTPNTSVYGTINKGEHYDASTGGIVDGGSLDGDLTTELFELGFNASFFDNKLYLGTALFRQEYTTRNQDGSNDVIETDGLEIELNYQPNRNFFATIGYSWLDSQRTQGFFATPYTADRADETGGYFVSPTFGTTSDSSQKFENPGTPEHLFNALAQYKFDNGFGVQANMVVWGEMNSGYGGYETTIFNPDDPNSPFVLTANTVRLDVQYEIDAKIFYEYENWRFELSAFNITDEENWDANNSGYGNGSIVGRPDTNYEVSVSYEW